MTSWYSRNPPDLAVFHDLDATLNKIGDITVREPVRQYYRILYYVQQIRSAKWCLFALFITLFFEFQISVLFPSSRQTQALVALFLSFVVLSVLWMFEHATFLYGGDPADLFETRDEEMAIAHELGNIALNALPPQTASSPSQSSSSSPSNSTVGALFSMPSSPSTKTASSKSERAPLAKINQAAPRSPFDLSALPRAVSRDRQVRAGLINFNSPYGASASKKK